jgi:hypothetical protein
MEAMAARATVSNVVGMIGTEASLSVQTATMKVQRCVFPITFFCRQFSNLFPSRSSFC